VIRRHDMAPAGSRLGVAVSGGADSVVLLHLLLRLTDRTQVQLLVLHVNHQLRGEESDHDEEFVRTLAAAHGLRCFTERTQPAPGNLEQNARDARREFFFRIRKEQNLTAIALGHTRSDQAETVLYRLLRGAGTAGLAGMRFRTKEGIIRPLLEISRGEVREWAVEQGIVWREDATNADREFTRNRLRNEAMPALAREFNPNLESVLANTALVAQAEEDYWEREIAARYGQITERTQLGLFLQLAEFRELSVAVQRRLLRRAIADLKGSLRSIDGSHIQAILGICRSSNGHDRVQVPGVDAIRSFDTLLLSEPGRLAGRERDYCVRLVPGEEHKLPYDAGWICLHSGQSKILFCATVRDRPYNITEIADLAMDVSRLGVEGSSLAARNWRPGDEIQLAGHQHAAKVKTLFQEHKVLLWERRHWPVVVLGDEIVWVRRFGCSAKYAAEGNSAQLRLMYRTGGG
jgi:tRNA(Ile)-lysidine synthase